MASMFEMLGLGGAPQGASQETPGVMDSIKGALDDPNIRRAVLVAGLHGLQPGSNLGSAGMAGLTAYESGRNADIQRQQREMENQRKMEEAQRADEMHRENVLSKQQDRSNSDRNYDLNLREYGLKEQEARGVRNMRDAQTGEITERTKWIGKRAAADINQSNASAASSYASAENSKAHAENTRQKTASDKVSDFRAKVDAYENLPEFANETDPLRRRALATQKVIQTERGYATSLKLDSAEQSAIAAAEYARSLPPDELRMQMLTDPAFAKQVRLGQNLANKARGQTAETAPPGNPAPAPKATPEAPRRVIRLEDINETRSPRQSSGTIQRN